jgi:hypothetical protein
VLRRLSARPFAKSNRRMSQDDGTELALMSKGSSPDCPAGVPTTLVGERVLLDAAPRAFRRFDSMASLNAPHAKPIKTLICQLFASEEVA